jgi:hypothetical protein
LFKASSFLILNTDDVFSLHDEGEGRETKRHLAKVDDDTVDAVNSSFCHIIYFFLASFFFLNLIFCLKFANKSHLLSLREQRAKEGIEKIGSTRGLFIKGPFFRAVGDLTP